MIFIYLILGLGQIAKNAIRCNTNVRTPTYSCPPETRTWVEGQIFKRALNLPVPVAAFVVAVVVAAAADLEQHYSQRPTMRSPRRSAKRHLLDSLY